ncbi:hypothetical protein [Streptomyces sp. NPDC058457]|uniref:hypothetical protein n=1 Tax=Streptomyces sp. NPDC058457 TaxID=3346507 RepID=UPI003665B421
MAPSSVCELRRAKFARRLPGELSELCGPSHGRVRLPLRLAWSGPTESDLDQPRLRTFPELPYGTRAAA